MASTPTSMSSNNELNRRELLNVAGGLGVSLLLPTMDSRAAEVRGAARPKSLITLWMGGGPSQLETWDPHPGSPVGGPTRAITTRIPGLKIADLYPRVAQQIDALSVIRSLVSQEGDHERGTYYVKTGYRPDPTLTHPAIGAIAAHELPNSALSIPAHISLGNAPWPARGGYLGDELDAFRIFEPGRNATNMKPRVSDLRQRRRLNNLDIVTRSFRNERKQQADQTLHEHTVQRAVTMMNSKQLAALDLELESPATVARYGDSRFGRGCLVARRLIETGVRAVEVTLRGFDTHANNFEGHAQQAQQLDPALASLIQDLRELKLLSSTVVLCVGEFGRTPQINKLEGRDHWPNGFSCLLGGGGLKSGIVIGRTDPDGQQRMPQDPIRISDLYATILTTLNIDYAQDQITPIGRPLAFSDGTPITRLLPDSKT
ncbi:MAG: DUF1501 domain-containing protein [Planctomycetaceae bacterium]